SSSIATAKKRRGARRGRRCARRSSLARNSVTVNCTPRFPPANPAGLEASSGRGIYDQSCFVTAFAVENDGLRIRLSCLRGTFDLGGRKVEPTVRPTAAFSPEGAARDLPVHGGRSFACGHLRLQTEAR